jgi:hypothetical protein
MKKVMKRFWILAMLAMVSTVVSAQEEGGTPSNEEISEVKVQVDLNDSYAGGTIEVTGKAFADDESGNVIVTITVTPDEDYYIANSDITVVLTRSGEQVSTREGEPSFAEPLKLSGEDPDPLTKARDYTFTVPAGFGAWVKEATFHQVEVVKDDDISDADSQIEWTLAEGTLTISGTGGTKDFDTKDGGVPWNPEEVTSVVIEKGVTSLGAGLFAGCTKLESITIGNAEQVLELGEGAIPEGVKVDVHGNLYNEYMITDGWKDLSLTSSDAVQITGFKFSADNGYDTFVSDKAVVVPSVLKAYIITGIDEKGLVLKEVTRIAAGQPVLVFTDERKISDFYTVDAGDVEGEAKNLLKVAPEGGQPVKLGDAFLLYNDVFYYSQAGTISEGRVYLTQPTEEESLTKTRSYYILGTRGDTTGIAALPTNATQGSSASAWYGLDGRRYDTIPTRKGIYIKDGRKVVIK